MARYTGPKCKLARREGVDLFLKSPIRTVESKCKFKSRPGQHGAVPKRGSDYSVQFREKQKVKRLYGILEKQFRMYYEKARVIKGNSGINLLSLLERRLDNVVYRTGFAVTRAEARQMVSHKAVSVNGVVVNLPSYQVKEGDVIKLIDRVKEHFRVKNAISIAKQFDIPAWMGIDFEKCESKFIRVPDREELDKNINENMIIELYSK